MRNKTLLASDRDKKQLKVFPEENLIILHNLSKKYHTPGGDVPALWNIDLNISRGEFVAILGKSGAGKSTLVNMITGIDHPDTGRIEIAGLPIHDMDEDGRARWRGTNLGVVFQFFQLLPSLNLVQNITIPMDFCHTIPRKQRKNRALQLLEQVGLADHANKTPSEISGGQQQRVAIARALANDPPILVADEPTGNLDSRTADEILDIFSGFSNLGKTIIIVTHDKEIAARATRHLEIADGYITSDTRSSQLDKGWLQ